MARKKSLVPIKMQVPAAIFLAMLLAGLMVFRAMRSEGDSDATVPSENHDVYAMAGPDTMNERVPVNNLRSLISNFHEKSEPERSLPSVVRNPFQIPEDAFLNASPDEEELVGQKYDTSATDISRARELNSMLLTGTSKIGDRYMAIVDGMVLGQGDRINGYTIVEVGEGTLILENRRGVRIVRIKEGGTR